MSPIISFLAFVLVLGGMVFVHELGHFLTAIFSGVKVEEFAFGYGPKLFVIVRGETQYRINIFPIGGYVKMLGEEEESDDPRSYGKQPIRNRLLILMAGVVMNFLLAGVLYFIFLFINSFSLVFPLLADYDFAFADTENTFIISDVEEGSPAYDAGIESGVIVYSADGQPFPKSDDFQEYVLSHKGEEIQLVVGDVYGNSKQEISVTPRVSPPEGHGALGVVLFDAVRVSYSGAQKLVAGFTHSLNMIGYTIVLFKDLVLSSIRTGDISYVSESVSGPVGVYVATDFVLRSAGIVGLLDVTALMSSSLAFMNLLPFPALDGGHVVLLILEKIRGKKLNPRIETWLTAGGFFVLLSLMLLISAKDLFQYGVIDKLMFWK